MKNDKKKLKFNFLVLIVLYLICAYIDGNLNCLEWNSLLRFIHISLSFTIITFEYL